MIELFLFFVLSLIGFYIASFLLGSSISTSLMIVGPSHSVQRVVLGYSLLIVVLRFCLRNDYPLIVGYIFLIPLFFLGLLSVIRCFKSTNINFLSFIPYLLCVVVVVWIAAYPIFFSNVIFYGNHDPGDLNGFSAGFLKGGNSWSDLMAIGNDATHKSMWWQSSGREYSFPDYRAAVSYDNFAMLQRWGLPIVAAQMSFLLKLPVWLGVFSSAAAFFFLIPIIIYDFAQKNGISKFESILLSYSVSGVSLCLLWYEGLFAHIAAMPILLLFSFYLPSIFSKRHLIYHYFGAGLLATSLLGTWGEGVNLLIILFIGLILFKFIYGMSTISISESRTSRVISLVKAAGFSSIFCVLLSPQAVIDFSLLTFNKISHGFSPGILGFNWSIFDIFAPLPFIRISGDNLPNFQLLVQAGPTGRIIESLIFLIISMFFYKSKYFISLIIPVFTIFIFSLARQPYIFWNVATILQPIIFLSIYLMIRERFSAKVNYFVILIFTVLTMYSVSMLQKDYSLYSRSISEDQFQVKIANQGSSNTPVAYITPSLAEGYLRLGWEAPLFWVNKIDSWLGLKIIYSTEHSKNLEVVAYFSCSVEGVDRCRAINQHTSQSMEGYQQYPTGLKVKDFLDEGGVVDRKRMAEEVKRIFGVEYKKLSQTLP